MSDNRNASCGFVGDGRGTVCIDTNRVLDSCRDRDCFENTRVYLSNLGEEILANATNVRARSAEILWAYVGVDEVPFNCGFYRVTIRYYVLIELEACLGLNRSQSFKGLSVLEKEVVLYGGEGNATAFSSDPENSYCSFGNMDNVRTNAPVATVETIEPIILGTKSVDCSCQCACNDCVEIPERLQNCLDGEIRITNEGPKLYISFGLFSIVRIARPAQLLVQATDYSVPDKECVDATNDENPCALFKNMSFPTGRFGIYSTDYTNNTKGRSGNCGCGR